MRKVQEKGRTNLFVRTFSSALHMAHAISRGNGCRAFPRLMAFPRLALLYLATVPPLRLALLYLVTVPFRQRSARTAG